LSGYILVMIVGIAVSGVAALWVRSSYSKYSKQMSASGLTGAQTARMILDRNNLTKVRVEPVAGQLTDHYDPRVKVVRLSEGTFVILQRLPEVVVPTTAPSVTVAPIRASDQSDSTDLEASRRGPGGRRSTREARSP
jgi:hypothetical protein